MYSDILHLRRSDADFKAGICLCSFPGSSGLADMVNMLHSQEADYYHLLTFEKRKNSYLIGRYAAKQAISALTGENDDLRNILIERGVFSQPIALSGCGQNIQVSISHNDEMGAAVAFPEAHPMGIDIEKINAGRCGVLESQMTKAEIEMVKEISSPYEGMLMVLWTAKEALSKILKTGMITPFRLFEVNTIELQSGLSACGFENFGQYKSISFTVGESVCSIVYPKKTEMTIDIPHIRKAFNFGPIESMNDMV